MTKQITVPNVYNSSPEDFLDGNAYIPKEIGNLKLLRKESCNQIVYYDWNLSFKNPTFASRPDNFGKDEIQVIFNINQNIAWKIDDGREQVSMKAGEVCIFRNKNYKTSMTYTENRNFQFKSMQMPTKYFETLLSKYFPENQIERCKSLMLTHVTKTQITPDMYRVLSELDSAEKYHEFKDVFIDAKMIELIALVLYGISYNVSQIMPRTKQGALPGSKSDIEKMENLRLHIQFNPSDVYKIPDLAEKLSMSKSKFSRLFKNLYGISIHQYIQEKRLEKAAALILEGSSNVSEAAIKSGYTNMSHFSKEFKKKFGILPKKYSIKK